MHKSITKALSVLFFVVFGAFLLFMGGTRLLKMNSKDYVTTEATITNIREEVVHDSEHGYRTNYFITVEYEVDGKKVVTVLSETPNSFYEGMNLTIKYNIKNPTDTILPGTGGAYIFLIMGGIAVVSAICILCGKFQVVTGRRPF